MSIEVRQDDRNGLIACDDRLLWVEWRNSRRVNQICDIESAISTMDRATAQPAADLIYIHHVAKTYSHQYDGRLPSRELRQAIMAHLLRIQSHFAVSAVIFETQGLAGRLLRGVAGTMVRLVPSPVPSRIFGSVQPGFHWLSAELNGHPTARSWAPLAAQTWIHWYQDRNPIGPHSPKIQA